MNVQARRFFYKPAGPLGSFVANFWASNYAPPHQRVRILPRGAIEVIINLSEDELRIYSSEPPERCRCFPGIVVSGTYPGALDIDPMRNASIMGIDFRPGGAFPFFGGAVGAIANSHQELESLWGTAATELREKLCSAATRQKRFQILEETLTKRLGSIAEHPAVSLALENFGPAGVGESVRGIAKSAGLSQRKFIQVFKTHVGLTPKLFCRVLRFQHAREVTDRTAALNWAELAVACGYYDQSHLIRDFREFSGLSPTDYLNLRHGQPSQNYVPLV